MQSVNRIGVAVRKMTENDLDLAHALSREQQCPHRREDLEFLLRVGEGVVAEQDGKALGAAMVLQTSNDVTTLGMAMVKPAQQNEEIRRNLLRETLNGYGQKNLLVNAGNADISFYEEFGFVKCGDIVRHEGAAFSIPVAELGANERIRPMDANDAKEIVTLCPWLSGRQCAQLIGELRRISQGVVLARHEECVGFSLFRRFCTGYLIGPTVAPGVAGAKALISHWLGSNTGILVRIDVPDGSGLSSWIGDLGLPCVGRMTQMIRGTRPSRDSGIRLSLNWI